MEASRPIDGTANTHRSTAEDICTNADPNPVLYRNSGVMRIRFESHCEMGAYRRHALPEALRERKVAITPQRPSHTSGIIDNNGPSSFRG